LISRNSRTGQISTSLMALVAALMLALAASPSAQAQSINQSDPYPNYPEVISLSEVAARAKAGSLTAITVRGDYLEVEMADGSVARSHKELEHSVTQSLLNLGVTEEQLAGLQLQVAAAQRGDGSGFLLIVLMMVGGFALVMALYRRRAQHSEEEGDGRNDRGQQGGPNNPMAFGKSKARKVTADTPGVKFDDVAGVDEAKEELAEVVEFLKSPEKFSAVGARIPKGVLLVGPPGTGKTLMARAVAGEANVPFFHISGSEFVELFVGVGASRVRDLFGEAKKVSPCIIFIDEIDAVGRQRGRGLGGGNDEREQTLNQILVEMDGFDKNAGIVVVAATNRPDILDTALLRPGRFDRRVTLNSPDLAGRIDILKVHARGKRLAEGVELEKLARQTPGFSGADLENLLNEAAILTARRSETVIQGRDLEEAIDRVIAGPERKGRLISEHEKLLTAYHEVGHALTAYHMPALDPVHKVTIIARGQSGGHTRLLPEEERRLWTRSQMEQMLVFAMGGMAAEEMVFGEGSTGASNDLMQATDIARKMVTMYGMSEAVGTVSLGSNGVMDYMGADLPEPRNYSEETAAMVDREVRRLVDGAHRRAREVLEGHRAQMEGLTGWLMEKETISGDEMRAFLQQGVRPGDGPKAGEPASKEAGEWLERTMPV
jgi:cell division protease FtsH